MQTLESQNSYERIRQLVRSEGKTARNLVAWSVPAPSSPKHKTDLAKKKEVTENSKPSNRRIATRKQKPKQQKTTNERSRQFASENTSSTKGPHTSSSNPPFQVNRQPSLSEEVCVEVAGRYSKAHSQRQNRSSKSPGRKVDLRARYWSYLFDNLHRAVDEIYQTCEADESIIECQEVLMTLDLCRRDFEALIERIQLFERSDLQSRSSNLAWEVRKTTSPTKPRPHNPAHSTSRRPPDKLSRPGTSSHQLAENKSSTQTTNASQTQTQKMGTSQSRPSSARQLNFTKNIPNSKDGTTLDVKRKESSGSRETKRENASCDGIRRSGGGIPTWADRVRGVHSGSQHHSNGAINTPSEHAQSNGTLSDQNGHVQNDGTVNKPSEHALSDNNAKKQNQNGSNTSTLAEKCDEKPLVRSRPHSADCKLSKREGETEDESDEEEGDQDGWKTVTRSRSRNGSVSRKLYSESKFDKRLSTQDRNDDASVKDVMRSNSTPALSSNDKVTEHAQSVDKSAKSDSGTRGIATEHAQSNGTAEDLTEQNLTSVSNTNDVPLPITLEDLASDVETKKEEESHQEGDNGSSDEDQIWSNIVEEYDAGADYRSEMSWADRCDSPPEMLPEIPRSPGRAIHLHQRLSSPSRKRPIGLVEESRRLQEEKQVKAQLQRSKLNEEKAQKSKMVSDKVREVRESRVALTRQRMEALQGKLHRAERLRESHLQEIVRKAQEEETKVNEISFINSLEAQNKKIEVLERHQGHEARLLELQEERQRRREEQQAKEEAALERRKTIEAERMAKLMELDQRRKDQDAKIEMMRSERERAREEAAKEKARERERKLEARNAALQSCTEELERKIQLKHDESSRRYDQQLEQKKKAASRHTSSDDAPRVEAYQKNKWCTICNIRIISEVYLLSHLRGRKHQEALASLSTASGAGGSTGGGTVDQDAVIVEAPEEHQGPPSERAEVIERIKAGKKRAKKLKHRMGTRVKDADLWLKASVTSKAKHRTKLQKAMRDLNKQIDSASNTQSRVWETSEIALIDRALGEMSRTLNSGTAEDWLCFGQLGGIASVMKMLIVCAVDPPTCGGGGNTPRRRTLPDKTLQLSLSVLQFACSGHIDNSRYLILSNKTASLIDLSLQLLTDTLSHTPGTDSTGGGANAPQTTPICGPLLNFLASVISTLTSGPLQENTEPLTHAVTDVLSYMVSVGLIDKLVAFFNTITGPIESTEVAQLVLGGLNLLVAVTACLHTRAVDVFSKKSFDDPTQVTTVLRQTELMNLMQLLYVILLHDGPPRHSSSPPLLSQPTLAIATAAIKAVNNCAVLDLRMVQACLGAEGISLEFRHIVSYLLWYCSHNKHTSLLHELILAVGYFCVLNHENQVFLQSGRSPTLLQLLCNLPFEYFSNPELSHIIYPTLISACYQSEENTAILEQEINCKLLTTFLREHTSTKELKSADAEKTSAEGKEKSMDFTMKLEHRFPQAHWLEAVKFFTR